MNKSSDIQVEIRTKKSKSIFRPSNKEKDVFTGVDLGQVIKSPLDVRKYKAFELPNGLKVMLISTLELSKSSEIKSNKTCNLKRVLQFNKSYLGIDDKSMKVRCECQTEAPKMIDKSTSTDHILGLGLSELDFGNKMESSESFMSFSEALNTIKNLIYGNEDEKVESEPLLELDEDETEDLDQECSAYLTVGSGFFNDPDDMPGMAHFCEHAAFLGSKKFPAPNQLFRLIVPHDGYANAYTDAGKTVFEISTSTRIFAVALEMLGDMIGFPLLRNDLVAKEMEALDAEFSLRQEDIPKYFQLLGSLAKEGHPLRKMDSGNRETLRVPNFHRKLIEWRASHYGANYITLALEAPLCLEDLEYLAVKYFSDIPSCPLPPPKDRVHHKGCPFEKDVFHRIYHVPSIYHSEFMAIHWSLEPAAWKNFSVKPLEYLSSLISHKGEGGLYYFLNYFGWASNVVGGCWESDVCCNQYSSIFSIYIDMTEEGFYRQDYIMEVVFGYLEMLCQTGPSESFFQECQKQQADFFHQRAIRYNSTYTETTSQWLQSIPAKYVLTAPNLTTIFDPELILKYTKMLQLETCNVMIFSQKFLKSEKMNRVEKFYKTPYASYEFPNGLIEKIDKLKHNLSNLFFLPMPNLLLREITCCGNQQKNMIRSGALMIVKGKCSLYYTDKKFRSIRGPFPQAKYVFWLQSLVSSNTVTGRNLHIRMNLLSDFLNEMIDSKFVAALAAQHQIQVTVKHSRLQITLIGPSNQLPQIAKDLFKLFTYFEKMINPNIFQIGKTNYVEYLDNVVLDNRWLAWDIVNFLFSNHHQLSSEHKWEVEGMEFKEFISFVKSFKKKVYIVGQLYGFVTSEQAFSVVQTVSAFMKKYPKVISYHEIPLHHCPKLPIGESIVKVKSKNPRVHTSVVLSGYQFGNLSTEEDEIVEFLAKTMSDSAYHQLRTIEQLGYVVQVYHDVSYTATSLFIELATQPKNFSTAHCNSRIDQFVLDFYAANFLDEDKFFEFLKGKPKIEFSLGAVQKLYETHLMPNQENYRKLSIQVVGTLNDDFMSGKIEQSNQIHQNSITKKQDQSLKRPMSLNEGIPKMTCPELVDTAGLAKSKRSLSFSKNTINKIDQPTTNSIISRVVENIQEFRRGLKLYPNTKTASIDDDSSEGSRERDPAMDDFE